jgi:hypothetical protein
MEISEHREINVQDASSTVLLSALARLHAGIMQDKHGHAARVHRGRVLDGLRRSRV